LPATSSERTACIECDLIVKVGDLRDGQRAACPRCDHIFSTRTADALTRSLAFAIASSVLLVMANAFPFLSLEASGLEKVMTLPHSALELYRDGYLSIAVLVLGPIVGIPAIMLATVVALLVPLRRRHGAPWLVPAGRLLFMLGPWSMVEVFLIGVLVSLVKIGALATVYLGISFWAYVAFAVCFTATLSSLDRVQMWREIEASLP
jgi:paraquat-inducible protein A